MILMNENENILDLKPKISDFRKEVVETLLENPKRIYPKFFYDDNGSRLFDEITRLEEYYPTRSELEILDTKCPEITEFIGEKALVIELGGGNGLKGSKLLKCLKDPQGYVLVDISRDSLSIAMERLKHQFQDVDIMAVWADYTDPAVMKNLNFQGRKSLVFLGSTIGNMEPAEARDFLASCRVILTSGETFTIGVDLKKDVAKLEKAYNDSKGVTARFNLNLLNRINDEFGTSIDISSFRHVAFYNTEKGRIEMHLESLRDQEFDLDGVRISLQKGELIHTENSYKYSIPEFTGILEDSGFSSVVNWTDSHGNYALFSARVL